LGWVEHTKKKGVGQEKSTTRYDSPLLILLSANRARRRTLMITNSNHAYSVKSWVVDFRKLSAFLRLTHHFTSTEGEEQT
jgi:hypothetical protein